MLLTRVGTGHYLNGERHGVGFSYEEEGASFYLGTWKQGQKIGYCLTTALLLFAHAHCVCVDDASGWVIGTSQEATAVKRSMSKAEEVHLANRQIVPM